MVNAGDFGGTEEINEYRECYDKYIEELNYRRELHLANDMRTAALN